MASAQDPTFECMQVSPHCGAEVSGIDLSQPLSDQTVDELTEALANHCVLFFRNQEITPEQQKTLGRYFGDLHLHPTWPRLVKDHPEIMELYTDKNSERIAGENWHTDVSCDATPPMGTLLYMLETPPVGGDTLFANMYAAFDALSPPLQHVLETCSAIHDGEQVYRRGYDSKTNANETYPRAEHPIVRTHPVSKRKALFVNRTFTTHIPQLSKRESDAILEMLFQHIEQPEFQCRFQWQPRSVAFWDNRCTQHHALWDYYPHRRHGLRVTIKGDAPY